MSTHHHTAPTGVFDPVCGMTIAPEDAVGQFENEGETYSFCSRSCLDRFKANPAAFVDGAQQKASAQAGEYTCPMHPDIRQQ